MSRAISRSRFSSACRVISSWRSAVSIARADWLARVESSDRSSRSKRSPESFSLSATIPMSRSRYTSGTRSRKPFRRQALAELLALAVGEVEGDLLEVRGLALLAQHAADRRRRREPVLALAPPLEPAVPVPQPDRGLVQAHRGGDARGQVVGDAAQIELSRDRLAHLEQRRLVVELLAEEELVERRLEPPAQHLEERDADEEEPEVEERRGRQPRGREDQVRQRDDERVEPQQHRGRRGVEERAAHDDAHVQHLEPDDRVREGQRESGSSG